MKADFFSSAEKGRNFFAEFSETHVSLESYSGGVYRRLDMFPDSCVLTVGDRKETFEWEGGDIVKLASFLNLGLEDWRNFLRGEVDIGIWKVWEWNNLIFFGRDRSFCISLFKVSGLRSGSFKRILFRALKFYVSLGFFVRKHSPVVLEDGIIFSPKGVEVFGDFIPASDIYVPEFFLAFKAVSVLDKFSTGAFTFAKTDFGGISVLKEGKSIYKGDAFFRLGFVFLTKFVCGGAEHGNFG